MPELFRRLDAKKSRDIRVLAAFVAIFCRQKHAPAARVPFPVKDERLGPVLGEKPLRLCPDCARLLNHGMAKLMLCPHDPKPMCKKCQTQCYAPGYREKVREVMKFSGLYLVRHGRLDLVWHYFM